MKKHMCRLKLISLSLLVLFVVLSCNGKTNKEEVKSDYDYIKDYFKTKHNFEITEQINMVVVITANGCPQCNKGFICFAVSNLNRENSVILVTDDGKALDISSLRSLEGNVFFDDTICESDDRELFLNSSVIFLNEKDIDTIIKIDSHSINEQFSFILSKQL
ncbi:MAG: hypothetical protein PHW83_10040 [Bacteroidales bacterium]|nr:hypothetical protein [Bacteroidales bacterium]